MSITSATAQLSLGVTSLYNVPQAIQGFAVDDAFDTEALEMAETAMGVDGILTGGYVPNPTVMTITLMGDSDSVSFFDNWVGGVRNIRDLYYGFGTIYLVAVKKKYTLTKGILRNYPQMPDAKKTLQPVKYTIVWQSVLPQPV
jgi:hypothetical protein